MTPHDAGGVSSAASAGARPRPGAAAGLAPAVALRRQLWMWEITWSFSRLEEFSLEYPGMNFLADQGPVGNSWKMMNTMVNYFLDLCIFVYHEL